MLPVSEEIQYYKNNAVSFPFYLHKCKIKGYFYIEKC